MKRQEVISKILKEEFGITNDIELNTNLIDEFGFESISFVELANLLAKETGIKIAVSQAVKWKTVQSVLDTISANEEILLTN